MKITFLDASTVDAGDINLDCIREHGDLIIHSTTSNNETLQRVIDSEIIIALSSVTYIHSLIEKSFFRSAFFPPAWNQIESQHRLLRLFLRVIS